MCRSEHPVRVDFLNAKSQLSREFLPGNHKLRMREPLMPETMTRTIDLDAIRSAPLSRQPYPYLMNSNFLRRDQVEQLRQDFPDIKKPGFLTVDDVELKGSFKRLIEELEGPELTAALSERFGVDL